MPRQPTSELLRLRVKQNLLGLARSREVAKGKDRSWRFSNPIAPSGPNPCGNKPRHAPATPHEISERICPAFAQRLAPGGPNPSIIRASLPCNRARLSAFSSRSSAAPAIALPVASSWTNSGKTISSAKRFWHRQKSHGHHLLANLKGAPRGFIQGHAVGTWKKGGIPWALRSRWTLSPDRRKSMPPPAPQPSSRS